MQKRGIYLKTKIPETPGVYLFKDKKGEVLYVGKAKNLKNRLDSYFVENLLPKTTQMVLSAKSVSWIKVINEFEAFLLEANLVKKYQPKYNIELKDDKSPLYIGITKDTYPRVITLRKPEITSHKLKIKNYYGPYLSSTSARTVLRRTRKIFPFSTHLPTSRICIYKQIGLCDPCPSEIQTEANPQKQKELRTKYSKNIRGIKNILNGKTKPIEKQFMQEIQNLAKKEDYEQADKLKKHLQSFKDLLLEKDANIENYLENPNLAEDIKQQELASLKSFISPYFPNLTHLNRIECFDIAHLAGTFPTASMVAFTKGEPNKRYYRHFKIYQNKKRSDTDSMREVITRRIKHLKDWGKPDLIVIDGGKPQLTAVHDLLEEKNIPFIGLAKRFETIVLKTQKGFREIRATGPTLNILQRMRDEAHRFARRLHKKLISNSIKV